MKLPRLRETMHPTNWDSMKNFAGTVPELHWRVVTERIRDSQIITESNWACALKLLGGEGDNVTIIRYGHWAVGWVEHLCVREGTPEETKGEEIRKRMDDYPILNETDYGERIDDEAQRVWRECYRPKDRIQYIREHEEQFGFHDFADLLGCVRGKHFSGYASELVS